MPADTVDTVDTVGGVDTVGTAAPLSLKDRFSHGLDAPICLTWELTYACNLACVHCRACAQAWRHPLELTTDEAKRLIDEIAAMARAGKPTIYARFPNKVALFTAVVMRNVATVTSRFAGHVPAGTTIEERLTNLGATLLEWALAGDTVDLMRVGISEADRFPDLANSVHGMARRCGEDTVGRLLSDVAQSDGLGTLPAFAPERLATTTQFFLDAGAVRRKAQSVAGRDRAPCRPQRRFLSCRLPPRRRELSLAR